MRIQSILFVFILIFSIAAAAQRAVPGQNGPASGAITRPGSIADSNQYDYWTQMSGQGRAGGVLLGKVAVEGEELPWDPILISVLCNGTTQHTTETDAKGRFVISTAIQGNASVQDDKGRQMETKLEGCTVQADVAGFGSNAITITQKNLRDQPDVGTVTIFRKQDRGPGTAVSETTKSAPGNAVKAFQKARDEFLDKKEDKAVSDLQKAVQIDPQFADAWYQLGNLQQSSNPQDAWNSYSKAATADPKFVLPYEQMAYMSAQKSQWKDVVENTSHELQLNPEGTAQTWYYNAMGNFQLGKADEAQNSAMKSLALDPQHTIPNTEQLLAVILAQKGDYAGALQHLQTCLAFTPAGPNADLLKQQIAVLEQKTGTTGTAHP